MGKRLTEADRANRYHAFRMGMKHYVSGQGRDKRFAEHENKGTRDEYNLGAYVAWKAIKSAMKRTGHAPSILRDGTTIEDNGGGNG